MNNLGTHVHLDIWLGGINSLALLSSDADVFMSHLQQYCIDAGATSLGVHYHKFGENEGFTGIIMLSESHASIHTWPEYNFAAIDIFMCGDHDPNIVAQSIIKQYKPIKVDLRTYKRGVLHEG